MNPVFYQCQGVLVDGKHLSGQFSWAVGVRLGKALLTCRPPACGMLVLTLEVGGQLTPLRFVVSPSPQGEITQELDLDLAVPANTPVRWGAAFSAAPEAAASYVSISMQVARDTGPLKPLLQVIWVNRAERLAVFNYAPDTHAFRPTTFADGRAAIGPTGGSSDGWAISLQGTLALVVTNSTLYAGELRTGGTATSESPRLEFQVGPQRIATLTRSGVLLVAELAEEPPTLLTPAFNAFYSRFELYSAGALSAVLSPTGLSAATIQEPLLLL